VQMKSVVVTGRERQGRQRHHQGAPRAWLQTVMNVDVVPPREPLCHFFKGRPWPTWARPSMAIRPPPPAPSTAAVLPLGEAQAIIHMAGIPAPQPRPPMRSRFHNKPDEHVQCVQCGPPCFGPAAGGVGLERDRIRPAADALRHPHPAPLTEEHPPQAGDRIRRLAKTLCEQMARARCIAGTPGTTFRGACASPTSSSRPTTAAHPPRSWGRPRPAQSGNLWSWVDSRDVGAGLPASPWNPTSPAPRCSPITAADTLMRMPSRELMAKGFPGVPVRARHRASSRRLLSIDAAPPGRLGL